MNVRLLYENPNSPGVLIVMTIRGVMEESIQYRVRVTIEYNSRIPWRSRCCASPTRLDSIQQNGAPISPSAPLVTLNLSSYALPDLAWNLPCASIAMVAPTPPPRGGMSLYANLLDSGADAVAMKQEDADSGASAKKTVDPGT